MEQLALEFLEPNPDLIILGKDPDAPSRWLVKCPDCGEIRSVCRTGKDQVIKRQRSNCKPCANRKLGIRKRRQLPSSEHCIVIAPFAKKLTHWKHAALVRCPICGREFLKARSKIFRNKHTYCMACNNRLTRGQFIESSNECIVLKQFVSDKPRQTEAHVPALVQCPICDRTYKKARQHLIKVQHTVCSYCATSGERNHLWKGGIANSYLRGWIQIAKEIRLRDNHTCQLPNCAETTDSLDKRVSVHHIIPRRQFIDDPSAANDDGNLICLCPPHHSWADSNLEESIPLLQHIVKEQIKSSTTG